MTRTEETTITMTETYDPDVHPNGTCDDCGAIIEDAEPGNGDGHSNGGDPIRDEDGHPLAAAPPTPSPWARAWHRRIDAGIATMAACRAFPGIIDGTSRRRTTLRPGERLALYSALHVRPVRLTPEDDARGRAWLEAHGSRRVGIPADFIRRFSHFEYDGQSIEFDNGPGLPVWTVYDVDGRGLCYYAASWQRQVWPIEGGPYAEPEGWWWK